jgi:hypothetical protein
MPNLLQEVTDVAPCMKCGNIPEEIEHALAGKQPYAEMRLFGDLTLVLYDFCQLDFGSSDPTFFGLPREARIGDDKMQFLRTVEKVFICKDKCCPQCGYRLPFLKFVRKARELHGKADGFEKLHLGKRPHLSHIKHRGRRSLTNSNCFYKSDRRERQLRVMQ